jgi:hypothetical protein
LVSPALEVLAALNRRVVVAVATAAEVAKSTFSVVGAAVAALSIYAEKLVATAVLASAALGLRARSADTTAADFVGGT